MTSDPCASAHFACQRLSHMLTKRTLQPVKSVDFRCRCSVSCTRRKGSIVATAEHATRPSAYSAVTVRCVVHSPGMLASHSRVTLCWIVHEGRLLTSPSETHELSSKTDQPDQDKHARLPEKINSSQRLHPTKVSLHLSSRLKPSLRHSRRSWRSSIGPRTSHRLVEAFVLTWAG